MQLGCFMQTYSSNFCSILQKWTQKCAFWQKLWIRKLGVWRMRRRNKLANLYQHECFLYASYLNDLPFKWNTQLKVAASVSDARASNVHPLLYFKKTEITWMEFVIFLQANKSFANVLALIRGIFVILNITLQDFNWNTRVWILWDFALFV